MTKRMFSCLLLILYTVPVAAGLETFCVKCTLDSKISLHCRTQSVIMTVLCKVQLVTNR